MTSLHYLDFHYVFIYQMLRHVYLRFIVVFSCVSVPIVVFRYTERSVVVPASILFYVVRLLSTFS
jgi:hypothetical protein